jgi:glycyl-tRNA synthetase beta chain
VAMEGPVAALQDNVAALPEFAKSEQFRQLATAFKRVRNIAREYPSAAFEADEAGGEPLANILVEPAEQALLAEIDARRAVIERAGTDGRGFRDAYLEAAKFEPVVARFFDDVFVMSDDLRLRQGRLRLMKRLESVILRLGDISEIVASE